MKICIIMEDREIESYAGLLEDIDYSMDTQSMAAEYMKNFSATANGIHMENKHCDENMTTTSTMEIKSDLIIKIVRKMKPIISAIKMVYKMVIGMFEDIIEDIGEPVIITDEKETNNNEFDAMDFTTDNNIEE